MYRIAVVTPDLEHDWASRELVAAGSAVAQSIAVDPLSFEVRSDGASSILIQGESSDMYDAFIVRGFNRRGEIDYQYEIFELLQRHGQLVVNSTAGMSLAESKAQTTFCLKEAGLPVPRTVVTQNLDQALAAVSALDMAVIKPLYGSHGIGIERIESGASRELLGAFLDKYGVAYVQEYISNAGRDIRAFVVGDDIPAAIYRIAREGEWKTNVYQGSSCEPCDLPPAVREICLESARIVGLDYTGVDVIEGPDGPVILELNGAPDWYGLSEATHRNVAVDVIGHVLRKLDEGGPARQPSGHEAQRPMQADRPHSLDPVPNPHMGTM